MNGLSGRPYFFDHGIRFTCQKCGACCTGSPGTVYVAQKEILRIADYLSVPIAGFIESCLYPFEDSYSIREHPDGRCFFYTDGCAVYPVRPRQCEVFPFSFENLRSLEKWKKIADACPGIGSGRLYSKEEILSIVGSTINGDLLAFI